MTRSAPRTSHRQRIRDDIRARLLRGEIGPADRLVDHALAADLGVSRMPVREALMQLVSEGYLAPTSRGFALPDLPPARIAQVFTLRKLLEPHAAASATSALTPADLAELAAAQSRVETAPDVASFHRAAEDFRNIWLTAVPNDELRETIQRYSAQVQSVRRATMSDAAARATITAGLADLLAAFRARDPLAAADRMAAFIHQAEDSHRRLTAKDKT